jgi:predicted amidohydrolase
LWLLQSSRVWILCFGIRTDFERVSLPRANNSGDRAESDSPFRAMSEPIQIGLGQFSLVMGDKASNCRSIKEMVVAAAERGCNLLVLPECGLVGWLDPSADEAAESISGPFCNELKSLAAQHRIAIVAGFEERAGDLVHNSAIFIDESGQVLSRHRKINELEIGRHLYRPGTSLEVAAWRGYIIGLLICADCWCSELVDALRAMGANLILSPCAWAVTPGAEETNLSWIRETYRQRIGDRDLVIVATNSVGHVTGGPWKGRVLQGNSLAVSRSHFIEAPTNKSTLKVFKLPFQSLT